MHTVPSFCIADFCALWDVHVNFFFLFTQCLRLLVRGIISLLHKTHGYQTLSLRGQMFSRFTQSTETVPLVVLKRDTSEQQPNWEQCTNWHVLNETQLRKEKLLIMKPHSEEQVSFLHFNQFSLRLVPVSPCNLLYTPTWISWNTFLFWILFYLIVERSTKFYQCITVSVFGE